MNQRIKEVRKALGLTLEKFGEKIGVKKSALSLVENGKNNVSDQMFISICREFNVNMDWLRTGEGDMFLGLSDEEQLSRDVASVLSGNDHRMKKIFGVLASLPEENRRAIYQVIDTLAESESDEE